MFCEGLNELRLVITREADQSTLAICFMAALCVVLPLDISQLTFAILGAALYALLWKSDPTSAKQTKAFKTAPRKANVQVKTSKPKCNHLSNMTKLAMEPSQQFAAVEVRKTSAQPVLAPSFQSEGWEGEVKELLTQITPTTEVQKVVKNLEQMIFQNLEKIFPGIEITGFANGTLNGSKAFGVAVPEVEIVARLSPVALFRCLHGRSPQGDSEDIDLAKLHKSVVRACADRLVSVGGLKFRRSAFKGQHPKVTLLVPQTLGLFTDSFPIDFSVNAMTPFYNAALLAECAQIDVRTQELILLVRRWAKDRGICHSAKGHLSPYVWGLLSIYYLQVSGSDETSLLPPVDEFQIARLGCEKGIVKARRQPAMPEKSVGALFKGFLHFFSTFDWRNEAVSVRSGKRASPSSGIPVHMLSAEKVGPAIEDPFQKAHNLGDSMTVASLARLEEELVRACELSAGDASLSKLLEPWAPAEVEEEEVPTKTIGEDWRRDAIEAQSTTATATTKIPPWRRAKP